MWVTLQTFMHKINLLMAGVQLFTLGPWVYWFLINGASQPGGQDDTALLPLFDMLNHDVRQEVSSQTSRCFYTVFQKIQRFVAMPSTQLVVGRRTGSVLGTAVKYPLPTAKTPPQCKKNAVLTVPRRF